jgi:ABC-type multidrug transport system fused ATPase/permease subunit
MIKNIKLIFKRFKTFLDIKYFNKLYLLITFTFIGILIETISVLLIIPLVSSINSYSQSNNKSTYYIKKIVTLITNDTKEGYIIGLTILLIITYIVKFFYTIFLSSKQNSFAFNVHKGLTQKLYYGYLNKPYVFHTSNSSGELISNINIELSVFTFNILLPIITLITEFLICFALCILMIFVNPILTILLISFLILITYIFQKITSKKIKKWGKLRQENEFESVKQMQEGFGGIKEVKFYGVENFFLERYRKFNTIVAETGRKHQTLIQLPRVFIELIFIFSICVAILINTFILKDNSTFIETLALFAASAIRLMPSINKILNSIQSIKYAYPVIEKLELEFIEINNYKKANETVLKINFDSLIIKNLTYFHPETTIPVIDNLNIEIKRGELIGIVGESGSGKSTLIDLILGLLETNLGEILVNNQKISSVASSWRKNIGYVNQNTFLCDESILKNVAFGKLDSEINLPKVKEALKMAQLEDFILNLPDGINSSVGERGVKLSGGQKQRIGIARALYNEPEVIILDEATSSLDIETEKNFLYAINNISKEKTMIVIAHRINTLKNCKKIYRMINGKIFQEK